MTPIRSGVLFDQLDSVQRNEYFDTLSQADGDVVVPEAVFGTNGWKRRLAEFKADPAVATVEFARAWDGMSPEARFDWAYGNALDRFVGAGSDERFEKAEIDTVKASASELVGGDQSRLGEAVVADTDYVSANRLLFDTVFGRS